MKKFLSLLSLVLMVHLATAQVDNQVISDQLTGPALTSGAAMVMPLVDNPTIDPLRKKVLNARAQILLDIDDLFQLGGDAMVLDEFTVDLTFTTLNGGLPVNVESHSITINSEEARGLINIDLTNPVSNADIETIKVDVDNVVTTINPSVTAPEDAQIENYIEQRRMLTLNYYCDYGVDVRTDGGSLTLASGPDVVSFGSGPLSSRIQTFQWTSPYNFPNYELQLLKLENIDPANLTEEAIKAIVDWDEALKIETTRGDKSVTITVAEGTGFYIWRVRPIGSYFEGGFSDARNWGRWSDDLTWEGLETTDQTIDLNLASPYPFFFFLQDPDDQKNWMYNRVILEEKKTGEGMVYANNLLQPIQSQAYSSTTGKSLISQTVMDYLGRPSLSTLPVPVSNGGLDGYEDQFFLNSSGGLYTAADYDDDSNIDNPDQAEQTTSEFSYYSSNNPEQTIPDAEGYPYMRSIYLPDGSGRVVESSSAGSVHAIGSGRTSKILYATPSEDELIAIFGDEAPQAENILKTVTIDPNGTASIAYSTIEGVTIATAMSSTVPTNLEEIDNPGDNGELSMTVLNETTVNTYADQKIISSKVIALGESTDITIDYFTDCNSGFGNGCDAGDCEFTLQFIITNIANGYTIVSDVFTDLSQYVCTAPIPGTEFNWSATSIPAGVDFSNGNIVTLPVGNWKIQKIVSAGIDIEQVTDVSESQQYLGPLVDLVADWMAGATSEEALDDFNLMLDELITNLEAAHASATGTFDSPGYQSAFDTPYFLSLETEYDFPEDYIFNPDYTIEFGLVDPGDPGLGTDPSQLVFSAACCENLGVAIPAPEKYPLCETIDDKIQNGTLTVADVEFSELFRQLYEEIIVEPLITAGEDPGLIPTYEADWVSASAGFGITSSPMALPFTTDMDVMAYHMLTDQYFTGNAVLSGSTWEYESSPGVMSPVYDTPVGGIPTYATEDLYGPYYVCDDLYECWYASVKAYYELKRNNGASFNIYDDTNEDQVEDGDAAPGDDTAGDQYDDPDSADGDPSILDQLVSFIISIKMKNLSDDLEGVGTGSSGASKMALQFNIPSTFMECAGYKFAAIIDAPSTELTPTFTGLGEVNDPILKQDLATYIPTVPVYATEFEDFGDTDPLNDAMVPVTPAQLMYSNCKSPVWMFKYYEYNPALQVPTSSTTNPNDYLNSTPNFDEPTYPEISSVPSLELSQCYHDFSGLTVPFCNANYCDDGGHHNWNSSQRYSFYKLVENAVEYVTGDCSDISLDASLTPYTCSEMFTMIDDVFLEAEESCAERADYFKSQILQMLEANCYEVVACVDGSSPGNYVSEAQVDAMVQEAVNSCGDYVNQLKADCIVPGGPPCTGAYPWSIVNTCNVINGTVICTTNERVTELFDPALHIEEKLARVQTGTFIPYGIPPQCEGMDPLSPPVIPNDPEPCLELNEIQSPEITTSN